MTADPDRSDRTRWRKLTCMRRADGSSQCVNTGVEGSNPSANPKQLTRLVWF